MARSKTQTVTKNALRRVRLRAMRPSEIAGSGRARTFTDRKKAKNRNACRGASARNASREW